MYKDLASLYYHRVKKIEGFGLYKGTADAITQNIDFIDLHDPEYVLILSGDHIYKMNYDKLLDTHIQKKQMPRLRLSKFQSKKLHVLVS